MAAVLVRLRGCALRPFCRGPGHGLRQLSQHSSVTSSSPSLCRGLVRVSPRAQTSTGAQISALSRCVQHMNLHTNCRQMQPSVIGSLCGGKTSLLSPANPVVQQQVRTKIYFSRKRGSPKTVKPVIKRFYRLHCGLWIRRKAGYKKKLWKKSSARKYRLRQHVFCNNQQNRLLDKMVTKYWKQRKWYIDDPFAKYHMRYNEFTGEPGSDFSRVHTVLNNMQRHRKYFKKGYRAKLQHGGKVTHATYWTKGP